MSDDNPIALLGAIEAADIACTRSHYALLTDREIEERQYRSCDIDGAWVSAESRDRKRVGRVFGIGLTEPADFDTMTTAMEWLRAEKSKTIRIRVTPNVQSSLIVDWLAQENFKQTMRIHQWYFQTDTPAQPVISTKRRRVQQEYPIFDIREIGADQAEVFARIVAINYRFKPGIDLGWWQRQVGAPGYYTFLAFSGDEPIGTGMLQGEGNMYVLGYGTTLKAYRKQGIQNAMIAARVQKARELGCDLAAASTFGTDQSSRNLRRQGFVFAGETEVYTFSPPTR